MITRDSLSANMYFKVNKSVLLMLQAHLKGIRNYFTIACPERSRCVSWLLRTRGHLSLTVLCSHSHPLLCSFRVRQLSECCLQESLYSSMWQSNFLLSRLCEKHHLKRKRGEKRGYTRHNSFNYSCQGDCQQMILFVNFVYFMVTWSVIPRLYYCCAWPDRWPRLADMAWYTQTLECVQWELQLLIRVPLWGEKGLMI